MGKSKPGLFTPVTGRVGGLVYFYRDGKQVQRILVKPRNPRSAAQVANRLKFALAGRLSGVVPAEALEGMPGANKVQRRGRFAKEVMRAAVVEGGTASIGYEDVVFSEGSLALLNSHGATAVESSYSIRKLDITTTWRHELPAGYGERFVVVLVNAGTSQYDYVETGLLEMPSEGGSTTRRVEFFVGDHISTYQALVYVYPFAYDGSVRGDMSVSYLGTTGTGVSVDLETGEVVSGGLVYGRSVFMKRISLTPPAQQSVPAVLTEEPAETRKRR